jgi:hypothetical protein
MTLPQILYAITISEQGSFNKASEVLYIAQPSLTEAVKELEKELHITIFNRSGRGVTLTSDVQFLKALFPNLRKPSGRTTLIIVVFSEKPSISTIEY